jgi:hypothetical protein
VIETRDSPPLSPTFYHWSTGIHSTYTGTGISVQYDKKSMNKLITIKYDKNSGKFIWVFGVVRGKKIRVPEHHIPEPFIVK